MVKLNQSKRKLKARYSSITTTRLKSNLVSLQGIDVNQVIDGRPLILYASDYGQYSIIEYLLSKGANPNVSVSFKVLTILANLSQNLYNLALIALNFTLFLPSGQR